MKYIIRFLVSFLFLSLLASMFSQATPVNTPRYSATDTLVNYCKLVRAAYKYGLLSTENKPSLTDLQVKEFNDIWIGVFDVEFYQTGITNKEFTNPRFREGNIAVFPPSKLYNPKNPDTYSLFHIGKEIGKINSQAYQNCPTCIKTSIDKINELIKNTGLISQFAQLWLNVSSLKTFTSAKQITDFWFFLRCYTIDDRVNPKSEPYFISLPPAMRTPDTTIIHCKDEIKPKVAVGWRHCEMGGRIDTVGPVLIKGRDNCPNAVYRITFTAKDLCNKSAKADQYFRIENDDPTIHCPADTIIDCIEHLPAIQPQGSSSCHLGFRITSKGPTLISGEHNCPEAIYKMEYILKDSCGRTVKCTREIRILNDEPTITCPPDETVTCFDKIRKGKPIIKTACKRWYKDLRITDPVLVRGRRNCPGAVYEITYTVTDSCDRKASCVQRFTINNPGPKIKCPQPKEIQCVEDIMVGLPESVQVSCDLAYTVTTSEPKLIYGKPNCVGAIYEVWYTVTDECGRKDSCQQVFTIFKRELLITCPPDQRVKCFEDIKPSNAIVKTACKQHFKISTTPPQHISGTQRCNGAVYAITFTVEDECGLTKTCVQKFTIVSDPPEIKCGPEIVVNCYDDIKNYKAPVPKVSCNLRFTPSSSPVSLVSGKDKCDGARYKIVYKVEDECGGKAECTQYFRIDMVPAVIACAPDRMVNCESQIIAEDPTMYVPCQLKHRLEKRGPELEKGKRNCPGAVYTMTYILTTECGDSVKCVQRFTIDNLGARVNCPPDRQVQCSKDIVPETLTASGSCGEKLQVTVQGPLLISGKPDCPNAKYSLIYTLTDPCNRTTKCIQYFTLFGDDLQVVCPPDVTVNSKSEIRPAALKITTSCGVGSQVTTVGPRLVRGVDGQGGAEYEIIYTITDECDQRETCQQLFRLSGPAKPDCGSFYANSEARLNPQTNVWECHCKSGFEWNTTRTACVPTKPDCNVYYVNSEAKWNPQTNLWECFCKPGYEWNSTRTACVLAIPDCNASYANSEARLNQQTNKYECYCKTGYEWNANRTACVPAKPDCNAYYANSEARLNPQTNVYECYCKPGYEWNAARTACVQSVPDCNATYANSEARWNTQKNVYECYCKAGYEWNATRTACVQSIPDCNSFYANSEARWNAQKNVYECYCKTGYEWNATRTACVQSIPDCNAYYANSEAKWNSQKNMYECFCKPGYQWNATRTACVTTQSPDCNGYYANSEARWNPQTNVYECYCKPGYQWNATRTACVTNQAPDCNAYYANSEAKWNPQKNVYECYCKPGYDWNATRTACVPGGRENPPVDPRLQKPGVCNTTYRSGANEPEQYTITLNKTTGYVDLSYNTYTVKDRIHVYQGSTKIFDSGCVGQSNKVTLTLTGISNIIRIVVDPLCDPTESNTQWDFMLGCPR